VTGVSDVCSSDLSLRSDMVSDESKITSKLRAVIDKVMVTLDDIRRVGSETLDRCLVRPMSARIQF